MKMRSGLILALSCLVLFTGIHALALDGTFGMDPKPKISSEGKTTFFGVAKRVDMFGNVDGFFQTLPTHWDFTENTGNNATVVLPTTANPNIGGTPLSPGDYVGVFTPAGLCCGHAQWDGNNLSITAWGDNDQTTETDGFQSGETIHYRVYRSSTDTEWTSVTVGYSQGTGAYSSNGFLVLNQFDVAGGGGDLPSHWNFTDQTGNNATVILPTTVNPNIAGVPLVAGDYVGVFTPGDLCCGHAQWQGENLAITAWGDDTQTPDVDGFQSNETIHYRVYRTSSAQEWTTVVVEYAQGTGLYANNAYMVLSRFDVMDAVTTEGTWSTQASGCQVRLSAVHTVTDLIGWAAGNDNNVIRTIDGGTSWTNAGPADDQMNYYAVGAMDANTAIIGGARSLAKAADYYSYLKKTTDGGATWTTIHEQQGWLTNKIAMFDQLNGIVVGDPVNGTWAIMKTTDGGATWTQLPNAPAQIGDEWSGPGRVFWLDRNHGWIGTQYDRIHHTSDGGDSWSVITIPILSNVRGVAFNGSGVGLAANAQQLVRTVDNGQNWTEISPPIAGTIAFLHYFDGCFWIVVNRQLHKSTDNGDSWIPQTKTSKRLQALSFSDKEGVVAGWGVGDEGELIRYKTGGDYITFHVTVPNNTPSTDDIYIAGDFNFWDPGQSQAGWNGVEKELRLSDMDNNIHEITLEFTPGQSIEYKYTRGSWETVEKNAQGNEISNRLLTVPGGHATQNDVVEGWADIGSGVLEWERSGVPSEYRLEQNYPNPFNPETRICFSMPVKEHVKIEIYDAQGKLIETLIDGERSVGEYELLWNAEGYASGIYLCRMMAGSFIEIKKLILQK